MHHVIIPAAGMGRRMDGGASIPKSLRLVRGRPILLHALDAVAAQGAVRITLIVGHGAALIRDAVGTCFRGLPVCYATNADYASTEHGWSLYQARTSWLEDRLPVLLMDADNVFDARLLQRLLRAAPEDRVLVDPSLDSRTRDEELVLGRDGVVTGFVRGRAHELPDCVGGFVGMNRFSADFMQALFDYMDTFFPAHGRGFKYERVFHRLLQDTGATLGYLDTGGLAWVNVNHPDDVARAEALLGANSRDQ